MASYWSLRFNGRMTTRMLVSGCTTSLSVRMKVLVLSLDRATNCDLSVGIPIPPYFLERRVQLGGALLITLAAHHYPAREWNCTYQRLSTHVPRPVGVVLLVRISVPSVGSLMKHLWLQMTRVYGQKFLHKLQVPVFRMEYAVYTSRPL